MLLQQVFSFHIFALLPGGGYTPAIRHPKVLLEVPTPIPRIPRSGRGVRSEIISETSILSEGLRFFSSTVNCELSTVSCCLPRLSPTRLNLQTCKPSNLQTFSDAPRNFPPNFRRIILLDR
jgi:hypothetical protein